MGCHSWSSVALLFIAMRPVTVLSSQKISGSSSYSVFFFFPLSAPFFLEGTGLLGMVPYLALLVGDATAEPSSPSRHKF